MRPALPRIAGSGVSLRHGLPEPGAHGSEIFPAGRYANATCFRNRDWKSAGLLPANLMSRLFYFAALRQAIGRVAKLLDDLQALAHGKPQPAPDLLAAAAVPSGPLPLIIRRRVARLMSHQFLSQAESGADARRRPCHGACPSPASF